MVTEDDILTVICTGKPKIPFDRVIRESLNEIKIADVRFINISDKIKPWTDWSYTKDFDFDEGNKQVLAYPCYRDWTNEVALVSNKIIRCREIILKEERDRPNDPGFH
jgi:hypothetical protein